MEERPRRLLSPLVPATFKRRDLFAPQPVSEKGMALSGEGIGRAGPPVQIQTYLYHFIIRLHTFFARRPPPQHDAIYYFPIS